MAGAVEFPKDETTIHALTDYAKRDSNGNWRAGPDAPGYQKGQFIETRVVTTQDGRTVEKPAGDIGRAFTNRQRNNLIKANMRRQDMTEQEARNFVNSTFTEIQEAIREGRSQDEITELQRKVRGS